MSIFSYIEVKCHHCSFQGIEVLENESKIKQVGDILGKQLKTICNEIAEHLGIDPLPIKFKDLGDEDSRLYTRDVYVGINKKYKDNYEEIAKCIAHEYRHVFQIFYAELFHDERAARWKGLLRTQINSSTMNDEGSNYINQYLEIDAFAFNKF